VAVASLAFVIMNLQLTCCLGNLRKEEDNENVEQLEDENKVSFKAVGAFTDV
jgi:hypothetical protein